MRVLVTGASGFVGGHLRARLLRGGVQVRACRRAAFHLSPVPDRAPDGASPTGAPCQ